MTIPFKIKKIEIAQFAVFPEALDVSKNVQVNSQFSFDANIEAHVVRCKANFYYKQDDCLVLVLVVYCYFDIDSPSLETFKDGDNYRIPVDFLRYMATIVVGTARGIIFTKTENTPINHILLPPINLVKMLDSDCVLLNEEWTRMDKKD